MEPPRDRPPNPPAPTPDFTTVGGGPVPLSGPAVPANAEFGPYRLLGEIGRGGMGVVYRALDTRLQRVVALKTVLGGADAETLARFRREAETVSKLRHPNVVAIHEVGFAGSVPFLAMDLLAGESLSALLKRQGFLAPRAAARITRDLARALAYAHEKGVIHRDLKPQNVMLEPAPDSQSSGVTLLAVDAATDDPDLRHAPSFRPVLMDFGLARDLASEARLTVSGAVLGTPAYMSPEQARGDVVEVDALSDVYSLGAVLYEAITGRPPFQATNHAALVLSVLLDEPVPPRKVRPDLSPDLEVICLKAMHKERSKRYASARAFGDDLERYLRGELIHARPATRRERLLRWVRRRPTRSAVAALLLLSLLAVLGGPSASRAWRAREAATLVISARTALAAGRIDEAIDLVARARNLDPSSGAVRDLAWEAEAEQRVRESDRLLERSGGAFADAAARRAKAVEAASRLSDWDPPDAKAEAWRMEEDARKAEADAETLRGLAERELERALDAWRGHAGARERVCRIALARYAEAEARRDLRGMDDARRRVEAFDADGRHADSFVNKASLRIASDPAGASVHLFRYEERDHRLVPCPVDLASGRSFDPPPATVIPADLAALEGTTPAMRERAARLRKEASALLLAREWVRADEDLKEAIQLDSSDPGASYDRALTLTHLDPPDPSEALVCLERAVALGWPSPERLGEEGDLALLRGEPRLSAILAAVAGRIPKRYVRVLEVLPGAMAETIGLHKGDVIVGACGVRVARNEDLIRVVSAAGPGRPMPIDLWRDGGTVRIEAPGGQRLGVVIVDVDLTPSANAPPARTREEVLSASRAAEACPLDVGTKDRVGATPCEVSLSPGSYLLVLRAEGRPDARLPLLLRAGERREALVAIPSTDGFPPVPPGAWTSDPLEYWRWVPAGPFVMGLDPHAMSTGDDPAREVDGFFIARLELTCCEYGEYVNDAATLADMSTRQDQRRVPRTQESNLPLWKKGADGRYGVETPDTPVRSVSMNDLTAYVLWLAARTKAGERFTLDLPTDAEWEKAARGVDGRAYPWGDRFEWAFTNGRRSRSAPGRAEPAGLFPADESPYGVRDMAGGVKELCSTFFGRALYERVVRGGASASDVPDAFRCALRSGIEPFTVDPTVGGRIVARPR